MQIDKRSHLFDDKAREAAEQPFPVLQNACVKSGESPFYPKSSFKGFWYWFVDSLSFTFTEAFLDPIEGVG